MSDEIIWEAETPPPKDWYVRHKVGEALGDEEAAARSAVDDIEENEYTGDMYLDYQQGVHESDNIGRNPPDYAGSSDKYHKITKMYTGGSLVDYKSIPDYSAYNGIV